MPSNQQVIQKVICHREHARPLALTMVSSKDAKEGSKSPAAGTISVWRSGHDWVLKFENLIQVFVFLLSSKCGATGKIYTISCDYSYIETFDFFIHMFQLQSNCHQIMHQTKLWFGCHCNCFLDRLTCTWHFGIPTTKMFRPAETLRHVRLP